MNIGRGYVYNIKLHIVFCIKYRKKIINADIEQQLNNYFSEKCSERGIKIVAFNTDQDHVHLMIDCPPSVDIVSLIKGLKGGSARFLLKDNPALKNELYGCHLWNPTYFVSSVGETIEVDVQKYIENQKVNGKREMSYVNYEKQ